MDFDDFLDMISIMSNKVYMYMQLANAIAIAMSLDIIILLSP